MFGHDDLSAIHRKLGELAAGQAEIRQMLAYLIREDKIIMAAIDDLQADVTAEDTVIDSAVALIQGFAARLDAAGTDPAKLAALSSDIKARTSSLAAAVAANTPAAAPAP